GLSRVLVATDIAARGIDVDGITHVVNYDMPDVPENYVHRIGRTARAGAEGVAVAFCAPDERDELHAVERLIRMRIPVKPVPAGIAHPASAPPGSAPGGRPAHVSHGPVHGQPRPAPAPQQGAAPAHSHATPPAPTPPGGRPPWMGPPAAGRSSVPRRIAWRKNRR